MKTINTSSVENPPTVSLDKYNGPWTNIQARHLLKRTTYGPGKSSIDQAVNAGLDETLNILLEEVDKPNPPINPSFLLDPTTPVGETWVDKAAPIIQGLSRYRNQSLAAWVIERQMENRTNIIEKMVLFWHNHFVVTDINDPRYLYLNLDTIRNFALGNFRDLTKAITLDPAMLRFLNGRDNDKDAPNENYARELLELFTVGKGDEAGPGDYTTFTEQDVTEISKILTGWRDSGFNNPIISDITVFFRAGRHDTSTKTLSHRFNNAVIENEGDQEYSTLIDIIFESPHVATYIARKVYRWFVYYEVTPEVEANIIEPLAQILRDNDYNMRPMIRALLSSAHFYDEELTGCMIKHPIEYVLSTINQFDTPVIENVEQKYLINQGIFEFTGRLQMGMFNQPNVAGWKAFYQEPSYYQLWINSVTIPLRQQITDLLALAPIIDGVKIGIESLDVVARTSAPTDINTVIDEISDLIFIKPLSQDQKNALKSVVLAGLPDFEWTIEYGEYLNDPEDPNKKEAIENKIKLLLLSMMRLPEYQLT